jgi:hypothetical protein
VTTCWRNATIVGCSTALAYDTSATVLMLSGTQFCWFEYKFEFLWFLLGESMAAWNGLLGETLWKLGIADWYLRMLGSKLTTIPPKNFEGVSCIVQVQAMVVVGSACPSLSSVHWQIS